MNIVEFLEARIAEDEEDNNPERDLSGVCDYLSGVHYESSRVLAECAAKRTLLEQRERIDRSANDDEWSMGWSDANYGALHAIATVYKDHPDYREDWSDAT